MKPPVSEHPADLRALLALVLPIFRAHGPRVGVGLATLIAVDVLQLLIPKFVQRAIDALADGTADSRLLARTAGILLAIALSIAVLRFVWRYMLIGFSRLLERRLRDRLFAKLLTLDAPFFERRTTGDLMAHASNDLSVIQLAVGMGVVGAVDIVVLSLVALGFMLSIDPGLTLIVLLPMPLLALCVRKLAAVLHRRVNRVQEQFSVLTESARAALTAIRLIKAYTLERFQAARFEKQGLDYVAGNLAVARVQGLIAPASTLVASAGMLLLLYFGGRQVIEGRVSIGAFVAFISYLSSLIWPMMAVGWVANIAQRGLTSLGRIQKILAAEPAVRRIDEASARVGAVREPPLRVEPATRQSHAPAPPHFALHHLTFRYSPEERPALDDLTFDLPPGLTGLTGRAGSGKSTLCRLLLRLYPVEDGALFFQGRDVNRLAPETPREHIAWAGQESYLFADSIAANIALGHPGATMDEIRAAAGLAAIDEEIMRFQGGYEAAIGERGVKLSGGQKQRIALARALLRDRPMLIIDDGLSAVDVDTEQRILAELQRLAEAGRTILLVSHRVNALKRCDRVLILEEGRLSGAGGHDELLAHPFYRLMHEKQRHAS